MATVKQKRIKWTPASDSDIVSHRVYAVEHTGADIDPDVDPYIVVNMPTKEVIAPDDFPSGTFSNDVEYDIGIMAVDDVGNLSDMAMITSPLDFVAPGAPTNLIVETV